MKCIPRVVNVIFRRIKCRGEKINDKKRWYRCLAKEFIFWSNYFSNGLAPKENCMPNNDYIGDKKVFVCAMLTIRTHAHARTNNERFSIVLFVQASPTQRTRSFGSM